MKRSIPDYQHRLNCKRVARKMGEHIIFDLAADAAMTAVAKCETYAECAKIRILDMTQGKEAYSNLPGFKANEGKHILRLIYELDKLYRQCTETSAIKPEIQKAMYQEEVYG